MGIELPTTFMQTLEQRMLLAASPVFLDPASHVLTIAGSDQNDQITIGMNPTRAALFVRVNLATNWYSMSKVAAINVSGGNGNDRIENLLPKRDVDIPVYFNGGNGRDTLIGGYGNDTLIGGRGSDSLVGGDGNDLIRGGGGRDILHGDGGSDTLLGGGGRDLLYGGTGADVLKGETGSDTLHGGDGVDTLNGDAGVNQLWDTPSDRIRGPRAIDQLRGRVMVHSSPSLSLADLAVPADSSVPTVPSASTDSPSPADSSSPVDSSSPTDSPSPVDSSSPTDSPSPTPVAESARTAKPRIEVAFVLDSTGSMGGLIEGAKQKIWSIATDIIKSNPSSELRMGLISYRDRGDDYVTRQVDLTGDIDRVYCNLKSFVAWGGGDEPESVNQALNEAVHNFNWSKGGHTARMVFLVGDCPPHMDYQDDVKYEVTCEDAARMGITINTIQCGNVWSTTPIWQEIACLAGGEYAQLPQSGGMVQVSTPYDEEIGRLSGELSETVVAYGDTTTQSEVATKVAIAGSDSLSAVADRAAYNIASGGRAIQGGGDLLDELNAGNVSLDTVNEADLPENLQVMNQVERQNYISAQLTVRANVNAQLASLSSLRSQYIALASTASVSSGTATSFDAQIQAMVNRQVVTVSADAIDNPTGA